MAHTKPIDIAEVEKLAGQGLTIDEIALCVGVHRSTLFERKKGDPDLSDAIKRGRARGIEQVTNALFQNAMNGQVVAQIFYLKNRAPLEWQDRRDFTVERKAPRPVEELSDEELLAITGEPKPNGNGSLVEPPSAEH